MNALMLLLMLSVTTFDYLARNSLLPYGLKYLPEVLFGLVLLVVMTLGARERFRHVRPGYWLVFGAMSLLMLASAMANHVEPGPLFAGLRNYLRAIPLFFLPAVYVFTDSQIRRQLQLLLLLALLQGPLALQQRLTTLARGNSTGDETSGTLLFSGLLSIFLISAACMLTGLFLRGRLSRWRFLPLFLLVIVPTTLNETKVTLFLLPLGLLTVFLAGAQPGRRLRNTIVAASLLAVFGAIFIPIYDYFAVQGHGRHNPPITEFFSGENRISRYLSTGAEVGARKAGRLDALEVPFAEMLRDPVSFGMGLGIGNASDSALGEQFKGRYFPIYKPFLITAASTFILEIGVLGLALVLVVYYLIFRDSRIVADRDASLTGAIAVGWLGVTAVIMAATFYSNIDASIPISCLFWYFSGLIAARRMRMALGA